MKRAGERCELQCLLNLGETGRGYFVFSCTKVEAQLLDDSEMSKWLYASGRNGSFKYIIYLYLLVILSGENGTTRVK